jgi:hypothetical protein
MCLQSILQEVTHKTLPLHDGQEVWELAFTRCCVDKAIAHGEFSRQGEHWCLQQLQFFAHWLWSLLPLLSTHRLPYQEFRLIEAFHNPVPVEKRTQIHLVAGEVGWIICEVVFCVVDNILCRGTVLPKNFHWNGHTQNACVPFPGHSKKIPLQNHWTDFKSNEYCDTSYLCFFLSST